MSESGHTSSGTAYEVHGTDTGRPPVVAIHGLGLSRRLWDDHVDRFMDRHQVVTYDLYGHGQSAPCPRTADLALYAGQIIELLDTLDIERAAVVGFSIGGMINRRLALDTPERVASLVIMSSPHDRGAEGQAAVEARAAKVRDEGTMATLAGALVRWFTPASLADHPERATAVTDWRSQVDDESYAQAAWVLAHGVRELTSAPATGHPTLVLTGEHDSGSTPAMSHAIAAQTDAEAAVVVGGYQHLGLMEDPHAFTDPVLDFLTRIHP
ncbi:MAG: alpha/beta fold hydrolase [Actinomycetota bacterium]